MNFDRYSPAHWIGVLFLSAAILAYSVFVAYAGFLGIDHEFDAPWNYIATILALFLGQLGGMVLTGFAIYGSLKVWGWDWWWSLIVFIPFIPFMIGLFLSMGMSSVLVSIKGKREKE